jgi:hypothetical protein
MRLVGQFILTAIRQGVIAPLVTLAQPRCFFPEVSLHFVSQLARYFVEEGLIDLLISDCRELSSLFALLFRYVKELGARDVGRVGRCLNSLCVDGIERVGLAF